MVFLHDLPVYVERYCYSFIIPALTGLSMIVLQRRPGIEDGLGINRNHCLGRNKVQFKKEG